MIPAFLLRFRDPFPSMSFSLTVLSLTVPLLTVLPL